MSHLKKLTAVAAITTLALAGCSTAASQPEPADGVLQVVTTTTQLTDFAAQIGGDRIALTGLIAAGASAHQFDPSPADLLALGNADVLIINGAGLDEFVDSAIDASGFHGTVVDASDGIDLALAREITLEALDGHDHDHDHEGEDHDHDTDESHSHAGDDHDHGDLNPHIWTSPEFAQGMVAEIASGLAVADPANATEYEDRAAQLDAQLDALDDWIERQFEQVPAVDRVLVTGHDSLRYYLHDYDIAFAGSLLPSFEDNAEPSAAEIDALVAAIQDAGVKAIFVESSLSPKLAQTVAAEAGITVADADALYVDSLGSADSGADTYIGATVHNTRAILEAWGFTPEPLPAELDEA